MSGLLDSVSEGEKVGVPGLLASVRESRLGHPAWELSVRGRVDLGAWPQGLGVRGRVGWGTWPRGTQCERENRLGRMVYGTQCERNSRLGHPPWENGVKKRGGGAPGPKGLSLSGRVGWGTCKMYWV